MLTINYCKLAHAIALCIVFIGVCRADDASVVTSNVNGRDYHHLKYPLVKHNIVSVTMLTKEQFGINGGQFDVLINKDEFPVGSPKCKSDIILRMPWTNPEDSNFNELIEEKYFVYKSIVEIFNLKNIKLLNVYIELNPYVEIKDEQFQLTQCNVFFRHSKGRYISKVGRLK